MADDLSDDEFVRQFESCMFPADSFHHRDHVRLAWLYLRNHEPLAALSRFSESLKRFAASVGQAGLYHETITWAFLLLIRERMQRMPSTDFATFVRENGDLIDWRPSILDRYYHPETLRSELARQVFLMPDRV